MTCDCKDCAAKRAVLVKRGGRGGGDQPWEPRRERVAA
jgi:hypothetical protein